MQGLVKENSTGKESLEKDPKSGQTPCRDIVPKIIYGLAASMFFVRVLPCVIFGKDTSSLLINCVRFHICGPNNLLHYRTRHKFLVTNFKAYGTRRFHKGFYIIPTMSQINPIPRIDTCFIKFQSIVVLLSTPTPS